MQNSIIEDKHTNLIRWLKIAPGLVVTFFIGFGAIYESYLVGVIADQERLKWYGFNSECYTGHWMYLTPENYALGTLALGVSALFIAGIFVAGAARIPRMISIGYILLVVYFFAMVYFGNH